MLRPSLLALIVLAGLRGPASAQPAGTPAPEPPPAAEVDEPLAMGSAKLATATPPYPAAVERSLDWGRRECLARGGKPVAYRPDVVRTGDLTGDGQPDFVVDYRAGRCDNDLGLFSGTGGWDLEILVTTRAKGVVSVFDGRVLNYDITSGRGPRTATFDLHGSFCGLGGTDRCVKRHRIDRRRFAFRS